MTASTDDVRTCKRDACSEPVVQTGSGRPRLFCSPVCKTKDPQDRKRAEKLARLAAEPPRLCARDDCVDVVPGHDLKRKYCSPEHAKAAVDEYHARYADEHREFYRERQKVYYANNRDARLAYGRQWRADNIERARERDREYHLRNRESRNAYQQEYRSKYRATLALQEQLRWLIRGPEQNRVQLERRLADIEAYRAQRRASYQRHKERYLAAERAKRLADPVAWRRASAATRLPKKFGITLDEYDALSEERGALCDICKSHEVAERRGVPKRLAVDHCHRAGHVRGLLCQDCNTKLGWLENEDWTELALLYLDGPRPDVPVSEGTRGWRWRDFGITDEQFATLEAQRGGRCDICGEPETANYQGRPRKLAIDHDHVLERGAAGFIRGLLCGVCNTRLAVLENQGWCAAAEAYLRSGSAVVAAQLGREVRVPLKDSTA